MALVVVLVLCYGSGGSSSGPGGGGVYGPGGNGSDNGSWDNGSGSSPGRIPVVSNSVHP